MPEQPHFRSLANVIRAHDLPIALFQDLLAAFSQDVTQKRYADYAEVLKEHCPNAKAVITLFRRQG